MRWFRRTALAAALGLAAGLAATAATAPSAGAVTSADYDGALTGDEVCLFHRPTAGQPPTTLAGNGTDFECDFTSFNPTVTQSYRFTMTPAEGSPIDPFFCVYEGRVNLPTPLEQVVACGAGPIVAPLRVGPGYFVLMTSVHAIGSGQPGARGAFHLDIDPVSPVTVSSRTVTEGTGTDVAGDLVVSLAEPAPADTTITLQVPAPGVLVGDDTARRGTDYDVLGRQVTIPAGQTSATFFITVHGDPDPEGDEQVTFEATGLQQAGSDPIIIDAHGTLTITGDDVATATGMALDASDVPEGHSGLTPMTVSWTRPATGVNDYWALVTAAACGSSPATSGVDFQPLPSPMYLNMPHDVTESTGTLWVLGDGQPEADETVCFAIDQIWVVDPNTGPLDLSTVPPGGLPRDATRFQANLTATGTIIDDTPVVVSASHESIVEGQTATVTISLDVPAPRPIDVDWQTVDGTARGLQQPIPDFVVDHGIVHFAVGQSTATVPVTALVDGQSEPAEYFTLTLGVSDPNVSFAGFPWTITIGENKEGRPPRTPPPPPPWWPFPR